MFTIAKVSIALVSVLLLGSGNTITDVTSAALDFTVQGGSAAGIVQ